jgi:small subunit ribosomal protein S8
VYGPPRNGVDPVVEDETRHRANPEARRFIQDFTVQEGKPRNTIVITLKYTPDRRPVITGLKRVSKPGLRIYTKRADIPRVRGGLGLSILSTPRGVMAGHEAWQQRVGGEVLCYVW